MSDSVFFSGMSFVNVLMLFGPLLFWALVVAVIIVVIMLVTRGARQTRNRAYELVVAMDAVVAGKRTDVRMPASQGTGCGAQASYTYYFAAFEMSGGSRVDLSVPAAEYSLLAEGDRGKLTFQGAQYLGFVKEG